MSDEIEWYYCFSCTEKTSMKCTICGIACCYDCSKLDPDTDEPICSICKTRKKGG